MSNKERCAAMVVSTGRSGLHSKHRCKSKALVGSVYCFQHKKLRMANLGFSWSKKQKGFVSVSKLSESEKRKVL